MRSNIFRNKRTGKLAGLLQFDICIGHFVGKNSVSKGLPNTTSRRRTVHQVFHYSQEDLSKTRDATGDDTMDDCTDWRGENFLGCDDHKGISTIGCEADLSGVDRTRGIDEQDDSFTDRFFDFESSARSPAAGRRPTHYIACHANYQIQLLPCRWAIRVVNRSFCHGKHLSL